MIDIHPSLHELGFGKPLFEDPVIENEWITTINWFIAIEEFPPRYDIDICFSLRSSEDSETRGISYQYTVGPDPIPTGKSALEFEPVAVLFLIGEYDKIMTPVDHDIPNLKESPDPAELTQMGKNSSYFQWLILML